MNTNKMWTKFWNDFNSGEDWRFADIVPSRPQELVGHTIVDHPERIQIEWIWCHRPKLLSGEGTLGICLVLAFAMLLPLVSEIGFLLDIPWLATSSMLIAVHTVRAIRWRRDYRALTDELSESPKIQGKLWLSAAKSPDAEL
jgi:hypothetical protein